MPGRYRVLSLCVLAYFGTRVAQLVIGPVVPGIRDAFAVSTGAVGLALSGMWVAYALSQVPSGLLADRIGERRVVLLALSLAGAGSLLLALAPTFVAFAAVAVALGAGVGLYYNAGTTLLVRRFRGTGRAIGLHRVGGQLAGIAAPAVAAVVGARLGWRAALVVGAAVALPALVLFGLGVPSADRTRTPPTGGVELTSLASALPPGLVSITVLAALGEFVGVAASALLPAFLVDFRGLSIEAAGLVFSGYFLAVAGVGPVAGWAADRLGRRPATVASLLSGAAGYALLVVGPGVALLPGVVLAAVAMGWNAPVQAGALARLPAGDRRAGFGVFRTVYIFLGAFGSAVVGAAADRAGWAAAFGLLPGLLLVGAAVAVLVAGGADEPDAG